MKKTIVVVFLSLITISCKTKTFFKEIVSEKPVKIRSGLQKNDTLKYLHLPLEFTLKIDSKDIERIEFLLKKDSVYLMPGDGFHSFNGDTNQLKWSFILSKEKPPKSIYIVPQDLSISSAMLNNLLAKYAPNVKAEDIGTNIKTLDLVPYKQFRKDFPDYIEEMRKVPDTFGLRIRFPKNHIEIIREQIKW